MEKWFIPGGSDWDENLPAMLETWVQSPGWEDSLEKEMVTHSSILAWKILWTEDPGGLQSIGSQRVGHDWATKHAGRNKKFQVLFLSQTFVAFVARNVFFHQWILLQIKEPCIRLLMRMFCTLFISPTCLLLLYLILHHLKIIWCKFSNFVFIFQYFF